MKLKRNISIQVDAMGDLRYIFTKDCEIAGIAFYDIENNKPVDVYSDIMVAGKLIIPQHSCNILNKPSDETYFHKTMLVKTSALKNETLTGRFASQGQVIVILNLIE